MYVWMCSLKYVCVAEWTKALDCKSKNYTAGSNPATYSKNLKTWQKKLNNICGLNLSLITIQSIKYFDTWIENLTENQILYYNAYSKGKKSPYAN